MNYKPTNNKINLKYLNLILITLLYSENIPYDINLNQKQDTKEIIELILNSNKKLYYLNSDNFNNPLSVKLFISNYRLKIENPFIKNLLELILIPIGESISIKGEFVLNFEDREVFDQMKNFLSTNSSLKSIYEFIDDIENNYFTSGDKINIENDYKDFVRDLEKHKTNNNLKYIYLGYLLKLILETVETENFDQKCKNKFNKILNLLKIKYRFRKLELKK